MIYCNRRIKRLKHILQGRVIERFSLILFDLVSWSLNARSSYFVVENFTDQIVLSPASKA